MCEILEKSGQIFSVQANMGISPGCSWWFLLTVKWSKLHSMMKKAEIYSGGFDFRVFCQATIRFWDGSTIRWLHRNIIGRKRTWMKPAAEGKTAVLLVKWKGVHLKAAGQHHLHGPVVLHWARGVDIHIGDRRGLPFVHAGNTHEAVWREYEYEYGLLT